MSKYRSVLIASMMISAFLILHSPAKAHCIDADQCTTEECYARQALVHPLCDEGNRSCRNISVDDKDELAARIQNGDKCLVARVRVSECFSEPDPGHQNAIEMVEAAIAACQVKWAQ